MKDRATVICRREDLILLVRNHGRWALPGGSVRSSESPIACARRELIEETTLASESIEYLFIFGGFNKTHHIFRVDPGEIAIAKASNEIRACRWFSIAEIDTLSISVPTLEIIRLAMQ